MRRKERKRREKPGILGTFVRNFDLHGHDISVNYDGDGKFRTKLGAFLSIVSVVIVVMYAHYKLTIGKPAYVRS